MMLPFLAINIIEKFNKTTRAKDKDRTSVETFSKTTHANEKDRTSVKLQVKTTHSHNFGTSLPNSPNLTS